VFHYSCCPLICHCLLMTNPATSCHRTCSETLWRAREEASELFKIENELASKRVKWIRLGEDPPPPGEGPFFLVSAASWTGTLPYPSTRPASPHPTTVPQVKSRSPARQRHSAYRKCTCSFHGSKHRMTPPWQGLVDSVGSDLDLANSAAALGKDTTR
jgi:hypothetical protein